MENKALAILSLVMGAVFALVFGLIMKLSLAEALFGGLLFAVLLFAALKVSSRRNREKYAAEEKSIDSAILGKHNGNITIGGKLRNGYIYVCEDALHIISLEKKPGLRLTVPYGRIESVRDISKIQISLLTKDGEEYSVTTSDAMDLSYEINEQTAKR